MLNRARAAESHPAFREFLGQRAGDILTDDYFTSESTWVRLNDNPLDLVIGPYEVYEDQLMGLKSSYEARVLWRDFAESEKIQHFQREIPSLCKTLGPYLSKMLVMSDSRLELSVADILYAGGFARKGIPAIALTLPNDEKVIEEVGSRQIILKNILEAKFNNVAWPVINQMNPDASVLAMASTEFDTASVEEGSSVTIKWRGSPVFDYDDKSFVTPILFCA